MHSAPQRFSQLVVFDSFAKPILLALNYLMSQQLFYVIFWKPNLSENWNVPIKREKISNKKKKSEKKIFADWQGKSAF